MRGKVFLFLGVIYYVWDHPRLCGEKCVASLVYWCWRGSPPPMRGKAASVKTIQSPPRITPAYAGKRPRGGGTPPDPRDHPRLCGEKFRIHLFITCQLGSPPPMRGKAAVYDALFTDARITPAYAGKSPFLS